MPRTARSRSADGVTIAALLPPSSSSDLPNRWATRGPTCWPIRTEPVARDQRHPRIVDELFADLAAALDQPAHGLRRPHIGGGPLDQRLAGDRRQRRQLGGLPDHGVTAHQRDGGVPRPHRDGEVERGDDADDAERMPRLHQPVARPLGGDGAAVQLPRQADGELADVDHLLHLAERLGGDLARLDGDQRREIGLVLDQQFTEPGHQRTAHGRGCDPPRRECLRRVGDGLLGLRSGGLGDGEQHVTGDRGAGGHAGCAGRTERSVAAGGDADRVQRGADPVAQLVGGGQRRVGFEVCMVVMMPLSRRGRKGRGRGGRWRRPSSRSCSRSRRAPSAAAASPVQVGPEDARPPRRVGSPRRQRVSSDRRRGSRPGPAAAMLGVGGREVRGPRRGGIRLRHGGVVALAALAGQRDAAGLHLAEPHPQAAVGDGAVGIAEAARLGECAERRLAQQDVGRVVSAAGPGSSSIIVTPCAVIRRYSSSMSSTRGVRWLMWVAAHPCDVGGHRRTRRRARRTSPCRWVPATARTRPSRAATKPSAASASTPPDRRDPSRVGDELGIEEPSFADEPFHPGAQIVGSKNRGVSGGQHRGEDPERVAGQLVCVDRAERRRHHRHRGGRLAQVVVAHRVHAEGREQIGDVGQLACAAHPDGAVAFGGDPVQRAEAFVAGGDPGSRRSRRRPAWCTQAPRRRTCATVRRRIRPAVARSP